MDALVGALAPRAFLLTAGETDSLFPIDGVRSIVEKTQIAYAQEDVPERFGPSCSRPGIASRMT